MSPTTLERMELQREKARELVSLYGLKPSGSITSVTQLIEHIATELDLQFLAGRIEAQEEALARR